MSASLSRCSSASASPRNFGSLKPTISIWTGPNGKPVVLLGGAHICPRSLAFWTSNSASVRIPFDLRSASFSSCA